MNAWILNPVKAFPLLLLFDSLSHISQKKHWRGNRNTLNGFSYGTKLPPHLLLPLLPSAALWNKDFSSNDLFISHRYNAEEEKCQEWRSAFLQMDLKREMVSQMSVKEFFLTFFPRAAFRACMLIFNSAIPDGCAFTRIHSWELLGTTTASDCRLLSSSSPAAGGGQGHLDGSCWEADWHLSYTNISQRQSFSGGRKEMSLFVSNLNDRGKFICAATFNRRTVREDLKETQGEKRDIWWDLDK